jgi:hypothetical protein
MQTPGLTDRLNRRSRRAGLAVGLSMAVTAALCIGVFSWLYAALEPLARDFVDAGVPTATAARAVAADPDEPTEEPVEAPTDRPTARPRAEPTAAPTEPPRAPTPTPAGFRATHRSNPEVVVNMRPVPGTDNVPVAVLAPGTPLQYLDDQQPGPDGFQWLKFRTEDGREGWLREGTAIAQ